MLFDCVVPSRLTKASTIPYSIHPKTKENKTTKKYFSLSLSLALYLSIYLPLSFFKTVGCVSNAYLPVLCAMTIELNAERFITILDSAAFRTDSTNPKFKTVFFFFLSLSLCSLSLLLLLCPALFFRSTIRRGWFLFNYILCARFIFRIQEIFSFFFFVLSSLSHPSAPYIKYNKTSKILNKINNN